MFKKGPLSKAEIFYIEHHHNKIDISILSEDLNRPISIIEKWIKKNSQTQTKVSNTIRAGDHFARNHGAVIMTENVSMLSDNKRNKSNKRQECITKIKND